MKTKINILTLFLIGAIFTSCSNHLVGTWTIHKYETSKPGQASVLFQNIGTMTFQRNGQGEKNITYTLFDTKKEDNSLFTWSITNKFVKIESKGSEFSKTWILIKNERRFQKWETSDGSDQNVILELTK